MSLTPNTGPTRSESAACSVNWPHLGSHRTAHTQHTSTKTCEASVHPESCKGTLAHWTETKVQQTQEEEALTEQEADNALQEAERRVEEDKKRREGMSKQRQQLAEELQRQKEIDGKYKSVKKNLEEFIKTTTDALSIRGKTSQPAQVKKTSELKKQILGLLKDPEFIEYEGKKNIGNLRNANKLLQLITDGSKTVEQRIKDIEGDKKEDIKRVIPKQEVIYKTLNQ